MVLSDNLITETLRPYGVDTKPALCDSIRTYCDLLLRWNRRVALTTVTDPRKMLAFHFGESMVAASWIPIKIGRLADVGSGAGFPGVPIKLAAPEISLILIEANVKKAAFLSDLVRELRLDGVHVARSRFDDVPDSVFPVDFITARALGQYEELLRGSKNRLGAGGEIVLWLGEKEAITVAQDTSWTWRRPVKIPGSERRCVLSGSPTPGSAGE